jgi:hypothetical protein
VLIVAFFVFKFYLPVKRENKALRLKTISLSATKRTSVPWSRLTKQTIEELNRSKAKLKSVIPQKVTKDSNDSKEIIRTPETPLADLRIEELADIITKNMAMFKKLDLKSLDKTILVADEILSREPNSYSAYKAKLISMLVKESKYNQKINENELNLTLENMASFEVNTDATARKEATLISLATNQLNVLEEKLNNVLVEKDELNSEISLVESGTPEFLAYQSQLLQLNNLEKEATDNLNNFDTTNLQELNNPTLTNEDVVEIPLMRLMAQNEFGSVRDNAQSLIAQYPNSPVGYFYLIKSTELQDETIDVNQLFGQSKLTLEDQTKLLNKLQQTKGEDLKKYWEKLIF